MDIKLSVLVPCYNVEKFLPVVLADIDNISLADEEYEVVFLDDGSTDATGALLEEFVGNKSNRKLIRRENKGISATRNDLIDASCGKYIWFVDADDSFYPEKVSEMLSKAIDGDLDILHFGYEDINEEGKYLWKCVMPNTGVISLKVFINAYGVNEGYLWTRMYAKRLFSDHNIRFDDRMKIVGDFDVNQRLLSVSERIQLSSEIVYKYRYREGSLVHNNSDRLLVEHFLIILDNIEEYYKGQRDYRYAFSSYHALRKANFYMSDIDFQDEYSEKIKKHAKLLLKADAKFSAKQRLFVMAETVSPKLVLLTMNFLRKIVRLFK